MDVLGEILTWSKSRPQWQRDALRRLVLSKELEKEDIDALTKICKSIHGLSEEQTVSPIEESHLSIGSSDAGRIELSSIYHQQGVNALANDQTLLFGSQLTVVYGDNGAGKSGYTRIIKNACRARGTENILGNVLSGSMPLTPSVSIKYSKGEDGVTHEWIGEVNDESISQVSVFDSHSAAVYLTEKTDVAFRPFGLDLFDKLSRACKAVRQNLEQEKRTLSISYLQSFEVPEGTSVAILIKTLSSLTDPEKVKKLATLSTEEKGKIDLLGKKLIDLQANNPEKIATELALRSSRINTLIKHIEKIDNLISDEAIKQVFSAQQEAQTKRMNANQLRDSTFPDGVLAGTGTDSWREMWEAARKFSNEEAYSDQNFPVTDENSDCVLCQQKIQQDASLRLKKFETFITSTTEKELKTSIEKYSKLYKDLDSLVIDIEHVTETINEIQLENNTLASEVETSLEHAKTRLSEILKGLHNKQGQPTKFTEFENTKSKIEILTSQLDQRVLGLRKKDNKGEKEKMETELRELKSRETLAKNEQLVLDEINRKKKLAAFGLCIDDTKTHAITTKSTAITKIAVTQHLKKSFQEELSNLNFKHVEVELKEIGGDLGNLYHKLILSRAPGVELPKVVSEGEARCLSIAAFFAELSTEDDPSTIIFDDPVSSLDYKWRSSVARRLVIEAKKRQVIVFTHDIVFLLALRQFAEDESIEQLDQHVRQMKIGAGVCKKELPWVALPIKRRIGYLKNAWQSAEKMFREGHERAYEKEASYIYGLLREAWERGLEEVLLGGVIERYRTGVQTQQINNIADITPEDCKILEIGMTKCSKWLPGHDQAPAAIEDTPEPDELQADIDTLEVWVKRINKRR